MKVHDYFAVIFSSRNRERVERITLLLSLIGFIIHATLIGINSFFDFELLDRELLKNPISAIYTPFSFILIYEIFLLVYYLPRSFTTSLIKQFEIICLILIRKVFNDVTQIDFPNASFNDASLINLLVDLGCVLLLMLIIVWFHKTNRRIVELTSKTSADEKESFPYFKKAIAVILLVVILLVSVIHLIDFVYLEMNDEHLIKGMNNNLNSIFYQDFFTLLILSDVLILLLSYGLTSNHFKLLRNTGFVISTILLRLSFGAQGVMNALLIILGGLFGYAIIRLYYSYLNTSTN
ncbi:MAG: hypothetical protein DA439_06375 [Bacteroidetes bacterium]|jgi:hypothetical protein|nr:MAG: hypothetical protein DA439_06375 [Bacteroidota bacterium]